MFTGTSLIGLRRVEPGQRPISGWFIQWLKMQNIDRKAKRPAAGGPCRCDEGIGAKNPVDAMLVT
jgi:hypothetical protein